MSLPVWLFLFFYRRDCRREMLWASVCIGALTVLFAPPFLKDYWRPEYLHMTWAPGWPLGGVEDFLYGFFVGGITNVIYEAAFGKHLARRRDRRHDWMLFLVPFFIIFLSIFTTPYYLPINSLYATVIGALLLSGLMIYFRPDLLIDAVISGILFGALTMLGFIIFLFFFPGIIGQWWQLQNLSGILIQGIPFEELLFAFAFGAVAGPFYEFFMGLHFKKSSRHL